MLMIIVEVVLKMLGFGLNFMGNKKKNKEWIAKVSETLRNKGWVRSKFVLELEADRDAYLQQLMKDKKETNPAPQIEVSDRHISQGSDPDSRPPHQ